ncbi:MAG: GTPase RsgA, partial [Clostridia bacterium]|nr:GTPase RsgA [Clostridia bacterium]
LINALAGEEVMQTGEIREDDSKGRHTTTCRRMMLLPNGVWIVDTPGMREIGLSEAEEGIARTFSDIAELESRCRFSNCRHESEPGCAVKAAITSGELTRERLELYRSLGKENADHRARKKDISRSIKEYKKNRKETDYE